MFSGPLVCQSLCGLSHKKTWPPQRRLLSLSVFLLPVTIGQDLFNANDYKKGAGYIFKEVYPAPFYWPFFPVQDQGKVLENESQ